MATANALLQQAGATQVKDLDEIAALGDNINGQNEGVCVQRKERFPQINGKKALRKVGGKTVQKLTENLRNLKKVSMIGKQPVRLSQK